jgi:hypothetical protein
MFMLHCHYSIYFAIIVTKLRNFHSFIEEIDKLYKCKDQHSSFNFLIISKLCKNLRFLPNNLSFQHSHVLFFYASSTCVMKVRKWEIEEKLGMHFFWTFLKIYYLWIDSSPPHCEHAFKKGWRVINQTSTCCGGHP